jgi:hypothetical protein
VWCNNIGINEDFGIIIANYNYRRGKDLRYFFGISEDTVMKFRLILIFGFLALFLMIQSAGPGTAGAQTVNTRSTEKQGDQFVDNDGDGYNDNAPDDDGDGIPNDQDSDYTKPADNSKARKGKWFVDEDGDGISDIATGLRRGTVQGLGKSDEKSGQAEKEQNGIQNALTNGLRNGQTKGMENGLQNALERGRKVGQTEEQGIKEITPTTGGKDDLQTGNSKNRFGREYLTNNGNFNNANKKDKVKDTETKK